jgi:hypothetical protein
MELKPYKKLTGLPYDLSKTVQYVEEFTNQFIRNPFLIGNIFSVTVQASTVTINHGLGAVPLGWLILDKDANADIWRVSWDEKTIVLDSNITVNIKIWIF